jgi:hypothetical protein
MGVGWGLVFKHLRWVLRSCMPTAWPGPCAPHTLPDIPAAPLPLSLQLDPHATPIHEVEDIASLTADTSTTGAWVVRPAHRLACSVCCAGRWLMQHRSVWGFLQHPARHRQRRWAALALSQARSGAPAAW